MRKPALHNFGLELDIRREKYFSIFLHSNIRALRHLNEIYEILKMFCLQSSDSQSLLFFPRRHFDNVYEKCLKSIRFSLTQVILNTDSHKLDDQSKKKNSFKLLIASFSLFSTTSIILIKELVVSLCSTCRPDELILIFYQRQ
jgi:hypothetical protein